MVMYNKEYTYMWIKLNYQKESIMNQKALAVISFGTTYTLAQDAIMQIESTLSCHVKEYDCFRAFTSKMVIAKLKRE